MEDLFNNITIAPQSIVDRHERSYWLRRASESDVKDTSQLIRNAYSSWVEQGLNVSPARQTDEQTRAHLCDSGYVATASAGEIVATITLEEALIKDDQKRWAISYASSEGEVALCDKKPSAVSPGSGKYLVFKKFAVDPELKRCGLGATIYSLAESYANKHGYQGVLLETVIEARWLYDWYLSLGFVVIGGAVHSNSSIETLVLIKNIKN